jgi:hypothetical protein
MAAYITNILICANFIMTNLEELSDSSNLSEDENVEEDPVVVAKNAGATFRTPAGAAISARKRKLPTNKGKYKHFKQRQVKHLLLQVPVVNYKKNSSERAKIV